MTKIFREVNLCRPCWDLNYSPRTPVALTGTDPERCIVCDRTNADGIWLRVEIDLP